MNSSAGALRGRQPTPHCLLPTAYCPLPEAAEILAAIGYGGEVRVVQGPEGARRALAEGRPDLIFTSETAAGGGVPRREARRIVAGCRPRPAVYALEPRSLGDILSDVKTVGDAVGCQAGARVLIEQLRARIDAVSRRAAQAAALAGPRRVACLLTADPPVAAGWWQAELIGLAGGLDILDGVGRPPRPTSWPDIERAEPELVVVLDGAPYPQSSVFPPLRGRAEVVAVSSLAREASRGGRGVRAGPGAVDLLERLATVLLAG